VFIRNASVIAAFQSNFKFHVEFALSEKIQRRIQVWSEVSVIVAALATIPVVILQENG